MIAGGLTDEKEPGVVRPFARYYPGAVPGQFTILTAFYFRV
jgi:hypothetical protein